MINVNELRNGTLFVHSNNPYKVLNYEHIKTARGGATIKVKVQNIESGAIKELSFNNGDRLEEADLENRNLQFLYNDGEKLHFMDMQEYTETEVNVSIIEHESKFLQEGKDYQVVYFEGNIISLILPASIFLKVAEVPPAVRGNTSGQVTAAAVLENGLKVEVPSFIKAGEIVKINTSTGDYSGRGTQR